MIFALLTNMLTGSKQGMDVARPLVDAILEQVDEVLQMSIQKTARTDRIRYSKEAWVSSEDMREWVSELKSGTPLNMAQLFSVLHYANQHRSVTNLHEIEFVFEMHDNKNRLAAVRINQG